MIRRLLARTSSPMPQSRLLIVDDHPIVLSGLRLLIAADHRFILCGEASDGLAARALAETLQPDLIVTDLVIGGIDGISLIEELAAAAPEARILGRGARLRCEGTAAGSGDGRRCDRAGRGILPQCRG